MVTTSGSAEQNLTSAGVRDLVDRVYQVAGAKAGALAQEVRQAGLTSPTGTQAVMFSDGDKDLQEAKRLGIPVVAVVDTNCNPDVIDHVIPGNDDALRSIRLFATLAATACLEGQALFEQKIRTEGAPEREEEETEKPVSAMDELSIPEEPIIISNPQEYDEGNTRRGDHESEERDKHGEEK